MQKLSESTTSQSAIGCRSILEDYCRQLYSPLASGNLIIDRRKPIQILQGETFNQFSQVFYKYSIAKTRNKKYLPTDFFNVLSQYSYFEKLDEFIHRRPVQKMTLKERLASEHLDYELSGIWHGSIDQAVILRMNKKYPGFYQIADRLMPVEYEIEQRRIRRLLISEISRVLWKEDSNWKKVTDGFNELKLSFYELFGKLDIPKPIADDWTEKIKSLKLVLPGSLPEISDEECSTTTANAYYYKYLNIITVCAGDFNSEDIILTLAHEMSHALDIDRDLYKFLVNSSLGSSLNDVRSRVCAPKFELSCADWSKFKTELSQKLAQTEAFSPQLPDFNKCLKKSSSEKKMNEDDLERFANKMSKNRIAGLASSEFFLRLIKNKLPMKNGHSQANPNFMNPCSYYLWSQNEEPVDDEIYTLIFFAAEYKCDERDNGTRLKSAIDVAQSLTKEIIKTTLKLEGEFSDSLELTSEGFASPPVERFADVIGTYAVSEFLRRFDSLWDRRTKYMATTSWLCKEPSLESNYPEESKIEKRFELDSHAQGDDRIMEILSGPIRESLSCEKDFSFSECKLPYKKH